MRVAALDLGTNTFILLVADVSEGRIERVVHDEVRVVRLGQGVHQSRSFHPEALERARQCFEAFAQTIANLKVERILACATSAARDVKNSQDLKALASRNGIPLEIISGEKEAELTFLGTLPDRFEGSVLIIDVGGGSTEFIFGDQAGLKSRVSVDIGSVRLTEMFVSANPISKTELAKMESYIAAQIEKMRTGFPQENATRVIAVAGTPTTLATLDQGLPFETERVDGYHLKTQRIQDWAERLAAMKVEDRQKLAGMEPKRADVIVAGCKILFEAARTFHAEEIQVSVRGLRYGIARKLGTQAGF
jgi:exopolyphosphatase/guanosine-5'-triphosphate,3'-diphosphate pyrophosphatase